MSEEAESPTRYMLPEQPHNVIDPGFAFPFPLKERTRKEKEEEGKGMIDYSLNEYSPAKYPIATKKKKRKKKKNDKKDKKDKKPKAGKCVHFEPKVKLKTIYQTLKARIDDVDLTQEEEYPFRTTAFALKRKRQKDILKYQHQYRPITPRRQRISTHIRVTLQRVNSSSSFTPQTQTLTQTLS